MPATNVYITKPSDRHDYRDAEKYGTVVSLFLGKVNSFDLDELVSEIAHRLKESEPEDYLLNTGPQAVGGIVVAMWLEMHGKCNLLLLSEGTPEFEAGYYVRTISKKNLELAVESAVGDRA